MFGPGQNLNGPYAVVIAKWILAMIQEGLVEIYGNGTTSRDFCYVAHAVQSNLLAAISVRIAEMNINF